MKLRTTATLFLLLVSLFACRPYSDREAVPAQRGTLNLSQWDFRRDGPLELNGDWAFAWQRLEIPAPNPGKSTPADVEYLTVPSDWTRPGRPASGYGVYSLEVRLPRKNMRLALRIPEMGTAYSLLLDGREIASNGRVGTTRANSRPEFRPVLATFQNTGETMRITARVANFHHRQGGMWLPLTLGSEHTLQRDRLWRMAVELLFAGGFLFIGIYHLILTGLWLRYSRNWNPMTLYFGLFCLLIALRSMIRGERLLYQLLPEMPWHMVIRLEYLSYYVAMVVLARFFHSLFPDEFHRLALRLVDIAGGVAVAAVLVLSPMLFSATLPMFHAFTLLMGAYAFVLFFQAWKNRREGARLYTLAWSLFFLMVALVIVNVRTAGGVDALLPRYPWLKTGYFLPLTVGLFTALQSVFLARRHAADQREADNLGRFAREINSKRFLRDGLDLIINYVRDNFRLQNISIQSSDRLEVYTHPHYLLPDLSRDEIDFLLAFRPRLDDESEPYHHVMRAGEHLRLQGSETKNMGSLGERLAPADLLIVPFVLGKQIKGFLTCFSKDGRFKLREPELRRLEEFCAQAAGALNSLELYRRMEMTVLEGRRAGYAARALHESNNLPAIFDGIHDFMTEEFGVLGSWMTMVDEGTRAMHTLRAAGFSVPAMAYLKEFSVPVGYRGELLGQLHRYHNSLYIPRIDPNAGISGTEARLRDILELKSVLVVPLKIRGRLIGHILFSLDPRRALSEEQRRGIELLSVQISAAVNNSKLLGDLTKLNELMRSMNSTSNLDELLPMVAGYMEENFRIDGTFVQFHDKENRVLDFYYASRRDRLTEEQNAFLENFSIPLDREGGFFRMVFHSRKRLYRAHTDGEIADDHDRAVVRTLNIQWFLLVPLVVRGDSIGIMSFTSHDHHTRKLTRQDLDRITRFCEQIAGAVHVFRLNQEIARARDEMNVEILNAARIQANQLPPIPRCPGISMAYEYIPMVTAARGEEGEPSGVGGDFVDLLRLDESGTLAFFVSDTAGHGPSAALVTSMVKMALRNWREHALNPAETLTIIREDLRGLFAGTFITAVTGYLNPRTGELRTANAGHEPLMIVRADGEIFTDRRRGYALMESEMIRSNAPESATMLRPGDRVVFYTDCVTECEISGEGNDKKNMLGEDGFKELVRRFRDLPPYEFCRAVYQELQTISGRANLTDDYTILCLDYTGPAD